MTETSRFAAQVLLGSRGDTPQAADRAMRAFAALGFDLGPCVGNSFSIEAPAEQFRAVFGATLQHRPDGGVAVRDAQRRAQDGGLPVGALPASLQTLVSAVVFTEPPAFGPGTMP